MSNEMNPPTAPLGSPERRAYWDQYWQQYGDSNETHREVAGVIQDLEDDVQRHQTALDHFRYYKQLGLSNMDNAINATSSTITDLKNAIAQKEIEFAAYLKS